MKQEQGQAAADVLVRMRPSDLYTYLLIICSCALASIKERFSNNESLKYYFRMVFRSTAEAPWNCGPIKNTATILFFPRWNTRISFLEPRGRVTLRQLSSSTYLNRLPMTTAHKRENSACGHLGREHLGCSHKCFLEFWESVGYWYFVRLIRCVSNFFLKACLPPLYTVENTVEFRPVIWPLFIYFQEFIYYQKSI